MNQEDVTFCYMPFPLNDLKNPCAAHDLRTVGIKIGRTIYVAKIPYSNTIELLFGYEPDSSKIDSN
jgi:hypothetical protein